MAPRKVKITPTNCEAIVKTDVARSKLKRSKPNRLAGVQKAKPKSIPTRSRRYGLRYRSEKTLTDLNYDCIKEIVQRLSLVDCLRLATTSRLFIDPVAEHLSTIEFDYGVVKKSFSMAQVELFWNFFTPYIKRFNFGHLYNTDRFNKSHQCFDSLAMKYLKKSPIEELNISGMNFPFVPLLKSLKNTLRILRATSCELKDANCCFLSKLPRLEYLDLSSNDNLTGETLTNLKNLKTFHIDFCCKFEARNLMKICEQNRFISLDITDCDALNNESLRTVVKTQPDLWELKTSKYFESADASILVGFKNLRRLEVKSICPPAGYINEPFDLYDEQWHEQLESLKLHYVDGDYYETEDFVAICKMENLKSLELRGDPIDAWNLSSVCEFCTNLEQLMVDSTEITRGNMLEWAKYPKNLKYFLNRDLSIGKQIVLLEKDWK